MPELSRFYGIIISIYRDEHPPPHFHARYGEYEASFVIETGALLRGEVPPRIRNLIVEWMELHQEELMDNWHRAMEKQDMTSIDPL